MKPTMEKSTMVILLLSGLSSISANNREYHFVNVKKTWADAQSYCREKFIDLATINNADDNQKLLSLSQNSVSERIWIGLHDNISSWKWSMEDKNFYVDGGPDFITWSSGRPDNAGGKEYCVLYFDTMQVDDRPCEDQHAYICYDADSTEKYILDDKKKEWTKARDHCRGQNRELVSIRSQEELNSIQDTLKNSGVKDVWIGLYREPWTLWSDNSNSTFTNWDDKQPNNYPAQQECGSLLAATGKWHDSQCETLYTFLCLKELTKQTTVKIKIQSTAYISTIEIQQQVLQQLHAHMVSKGLAKFKIQFRSVQRFHKNQKKKQDGEGDCTNTTVTG